MDTIPTQYKDNHKERMEESGSLLHVPQGEKNE